MPNWITNILAITGKPKEIERLMDAVKGERSAKEKTPFDFNKIIPMPACLKGITTGSRLLGGVKVSQWREMGDDGAPHAIDGEELERIKQEAGGCESWYDWSCKHWGTKWDACHPDEPEVQRASNGKTVTVIYRFDTAWAPPIPVLEALSKQFPTVMLSLHEDDEGDNQWDEWSIVNGKVTHTDSGLKEGSDDGEEEEEAPAEITHEKN
jgi:hypothetical protein